VLQFLSAPRMRKQLRWKQPLKQWKWEQYSHYVNYLFLLANKITVINPSQHYMMHWRDFTSRRVLLKSRDCQSLRQPKRMNNWQQNLVGCEYKCFIKIIQLLRLRCTAVKWLHRPNEGIFRCAWIEPNNGQPNGQILISRVQKCVRNVQIVMLEKLDCI